MENLYRVIVDYLDVVLALGAAPQATTDPTEITMEDTTDTKIRRIQRTNTRTHTRTHMEETDTTHEENSTVSCQNFELIESYVKFLEIQI
jgi:hypothetical protein